jgi:hypothetical protein
MRFEQRRALRLEVDLPARYRSGTASIDGRARDLSQAGVFFVTPEADLPGEAFLEIDLPDDDPTRPLVLAGEVRRITDGGMGIRFAALPIEDRRRLANFLIHRAYAPPSRAPHAGRE